MVEPRSALLLRDVTKVFETRKRSPGKMFSTRAKVTALNGVNLRLERGEALGVIGGNGSGKTTLLKIMSGALSPTSGKVMAPFRPRLVTLSGLQLPNLTVVENTELVLRAHGHTASEAKWYARELIELAELEDKTFLPYNTLSTGMRARLGFYLATMNKPEILLMDEMLSVADGRFRETAKRLLAEMTHRAQAIVIASHSMATITGNCSQVLVLHKGEIVYCGEPLEAVELYESVKKWD